MAKPKELKDYFETIQVDRGESIISKDAYKCKICGWVYDPQGTIILGQPNPLKEHLIFSHILAKQLTPPIIKESI